MRATLGLAVSALVLLLAGCGGGPPAKYYYYPAWGFSVALPSPPTVTETPVGPSVVRNIKVVDEAGSDDLAVYAAELETNNNDIDQLADAAAAAVAKSLGGEVGARTYAATIQTTNQATGREITIDKDGQPTLTLRIYLVGHRFYQLAASTDSGPAAKAFLDSFTIIAGAPVANAPAATNAVP